MLKYIKQAFMAMFCFIAVSCESENELHEVPSPVQIFGDTDYTIAEKPEIDVLLVLDNSCSMIGDWDYITYGISQIPEELNFYNFDWKLALVSMDPSDSVFMELDSTQADPGWSMLTLINDFRMIAGQSEFAFDSAIAKKVRHSEWFRVGVKTLIVFISDEKEQSVIEPQNFSNLWVDPHVVASIVGPRYPIEGGMPCAETAEDYYLVSHITVDICTTQRWSVIEPIIP